MPQQLQVHARGYPAQAAALAPQGKFPVTNKLTIQPNPSQSNSYKFTREDIQRKLQARREKGELVGTFLAEQARLEGLMEAAEIAGQFEEAAQ